MVAAVSSNRLRPGEEAQIKVVVDTSGKIGAVEKHIYVFSNDNNNPRVTLSLAIDVIHFETGGKTIFDCECVSCHVEPGEGKLGQELYVAICAYCHGHGENGESATGLLEMGKLEKRYLETAIAEGVSGSPMLGFGQSRGGPLGKQEITSLAEYIRTFASKYKIK